MTQTINDIIPLHSQKFVGQQSGQIDNVHFLKWLRQMQHMKWK